MLVFLAANTLMIYPVHQHLLSKLPGYALSVEQLFLLHTGMVAINCIVASFMPKQTAIEYLGQVNMLTLVTNLLLVPLLITDAYMNLHNWVNYLYLGLLTLVIFTEYFRRMDYANILNSYKPVVTINLACIIGLFIFLFVPFNQ